MDQIEEEDLFNSLDEESNSITVIVKHLWGSMLSRWTIEGIQSREGY